MNQQHLNAILSARSAGRAVVLMTRLSDGHQELWQEDTAGNAAEIPEDLEAAARDALRLDKSRCVEIAGDTWFVHQYNSPLRMVVVGAVHIAQALVPLAVRTGYDVTIVDPRQAFASEARFPEVRLKHQWPDEALASLELDRRTAVVTLTHDPKLDDPALQVALRSPVFYIGSLGSRKTHGARLERLYDAGFSAEETARIHGPIGLNIGASSPAEIALAIMAEITQHLRQVPELVS